MKITPDHSFGNWILILKDWMPLGVCTEADLEAKTFRRIRYHGPSYGVPDKEPMMFEGHVMKDQGGEPLYTETGTFDHFTVVPESQGTPAGTVGKVKHLPACISYKDAVQEMDKHYPGKFTQ